MNIRMKEDIERHIRSAVSDLVPDRAEQIWEQPVKKAVGDEWFLEGTSKKKSRVSPRHLAVAVAACLVICFLSLFPANFFTAATVYLDVNPSVSIRVNERNKVIDAKANNPDGEVILEDMKLKHTDLDIAVNAILGSMVKHGYLNEAQNMILLSVDGKDEKRAEELRIHLTDDINSYVTSILGAGSILNQSIPEDDDLEDLAEHYGITPGKAWLLKKLIAENPDLRYSDLAGLPMNELAKLLRSKGVDLRNYVNYSGRWEYDDDDELTDDDDDDDETEKASGGTSLTPQTSGGTGAYSDDDDPEDNDWDPGDDDDRYDSLDDDGPDYEDNDYDDVPEADEESDDYDDDED